MAKKFGIQFEGFNELIKDFENLGGDIRLITEDCLKAAHEIVTPKLKADMNRHHRTGDTEKSIKINPTITWEGTTASIDVGFKISQGGLPSIFLMYGTPRMPKDTKLYNDIYGGAVRKLIAQRQEEILQDAIQKRLGG